MGSGVSSCPSITVTLTAMVVILGIYIGWPCPAFSENLSNWKKDASYFTTKGRKIFYKDARGEGKLVPKGTILLLHGFPTMSYDWVKMWPALLKNFNRVVAVDFLGFGLSDKPLNYNYTIMEQADLVTDLLRVLKVTELHILAHDYGDSVAQELLARHNMGETQYAVKSTCLLNGGMFKETNFPRPLQRLLVTSPTLGQLLSRISNRYLYRAGLSDIFGPNTKPTADEMYDFYCGYCHKEGYLNSADILGYIAERGRNNIRWREALQKSSTPVHVIYGPADPVNPPGFIDFYKKEIVDGTIDVLADDIGHYPQWEDSETVTKLYLQFVASTLKK